MREGGWIFMIISKNYKGSFNHWRCFSKNPFPNEMWQHQKKQGCFGCLCFFVNLNHLLSPPPKKKEIAASMWWKVSWPHRLETKLTTPQALEWLDPDLWRVDVLTPIENGGFSMAMLVYQRVSSNICDFHLYFGEMIPFCVSKHTVW